MRKIIGVLSSTAAMKSLEAVKGGKKCKAGSWGTFVHIDIFQGGYFLGEVFCLGLGFLFLTHPPLEYFVLSSLFVAISFKCCFFLEPRNCPQFRKHREEVDVNKLELFASNFFFYIRKLATVMESCI